MKIKKEDLALGETPNTAEKIQEAFMKIRHSATDQKELIIREWIEINGKTISEYTDVYSVDEIIKRLNEINELRAENERLKEKTNLTIRTMIEKMRATADRVEIRRNNNTIVEFDPTYIDSVLDEVLDKEVDDWFCSFKNEYSYRVVINYVEED